VVFISFQFIFAMMEVV